MNNMQDTGGAWGGGGGGEGEGRSLKDLFAAAVGLAVHERAAFLDRVCAGDSALKDRVLDLLRVHDAGAHFLANPTAQGGAGGGGGVSTATGPITEGPGSRVGRYKVLQLIGEGGFGSVFLAEQSEPVRRRVALKIIKLGMDTRSVIARFEAERQALALMDHPHIARVLDAGATDSGRPYFVMEYVVGDPINAFADAHRLSLPDRLGLLQQVCSAVQHAHTKGVIHRDIKPGNVLVSMVDGKPFAKVIDFGIAKATAAPLTEKTLFTEHRQLIGTPEYMSPEQAEGSPDIDTRTDVYALGVLLYELLTGDTPFDAHRLRSAAWGEMQRIIREEEPPMPSVRLMKPTLRPNEPSAHAEGTSTPQSTTPSHASAAQASPHSRVGLNGTIDPRTIKGELDWIVMKAIDKERARRYETPSALAADVERHLKGEAVVAAPVSAVYRFRKFVRRNRAVVTGVAAVGAALMVGVTGTSVGFVQAHRANLALSRQKQNLMSAVESILVASSTPSHLSSPGATNVVALGDGVAFERVQDGRDPSVIRYTVYRDGVRQDVDEDMLIQAISMLAQINVKAAVKLQGELEVSNAQLRAQVDAAKSGFLSLMNDLSNGEGFLLTGTPGPDSYSQEVDAHGRTVYVYTNPSGATVRATAERNAEGRLVLTDVKAEGPSADGYLLELLVHSGRAAAGQLREETRTARLAEADATVAANQLGAFVPSRDLRGHDLADSMLRAYRTRRDILGAHHPDTLDAALSSAWVLQSADYGVGEVARGMEIMRDALREYYEQGGAPSWFSVAAEGALAVLLVDCNECGMKPQEEARSHIAHARKLAALVREPINGEDAFVRSVGNGYCDLGLSTGLLRLDPDKRPEHVRVHLAERALWIEEHGAFRLYRSGRATEAAEAIEHAVSIRSELKKAPDFMITTLDAMIKQSVGRRDLALDALAQARAIMSDPANADTLAKNDDAKALLAEAGALIEGTK